MKNKLYYILFVLYVLVIGLILYSNGVFTNDITSLSNLIINMLFLITIGIMFIVSASGFARLNRCTDALTDTKDKILKEYTEKQSCLWNDYQDKKDIFNNEILDELFAKYQKRIKGYRTKRGLSNTCDLEEYINEDLLDQAGMSYFNAGVSGTLTGLGILGTFIGLSLGLGSFSGDDIFTISDNVGPLLDGMKVAFHTSVYGIFFSLVFNFIYRSIMADAYEKLENFISSFRGCVMPAPVTVDENIGAMLIYQANMANSMKTMTELLKGDALEHTKGVEQIVNRFTEQMSQTLGADFEKLGNTLKETCEAQRDYADNCRSMEEAATALLQANRTMQKALEHVLERQEVFADELKEQKDKLSDTCDTLNDEISNQLYTFRQMGDIYEKQA